MVVSTDVDFSFNVTGNRDLVANYALGDRIDLVADPKTAGDVSGAGVFENGTEVTVTAEAAARLHLPRLDGRRHQCEHRRELHLHVRGVPRSLIARFAALPKIVTTPAPTPGQLVFTWPDTPNWVLTESSDLATWKNSTRPVTTTGGQNSVTVNPSEGRVFFRLSYQ